MAWIRLDDGFLTHPKLVNLSHGALFVHISGLQYANFHLTNGFIPDAAVPSVVSAARAKTAHFNELAEAQIWTREEVAEPHPFLPPGAYWVIHDYLDYQEERAVVLKRREDAAERQRRRRARQRSDTDDDGVTHEVTRESQRTSRVSHTTSIPSHPIPSTSTSSSSSSQLYAAMPAAAAAALKKFAAHRGAHNIDGWSIALIERGDSEYTNLLNHLEQHPKASVDELCTAVLGMGELDIYRATKGTA